MYLAFITILCIYIMSVMIPAIPEITMHLSAKHEKYKRKDFTKRARYILPFIRQKECIYEQQYVIANKNCIIKYFNRQNLANRLICIDKNSNEQLEVSYVGFSGFSDGFLEMKSFFEKTICEKFDYDTKYDELKALFIKTFPKNTINICKIGDKNISAIDINNASVAELVGIPGINAAKANKIVKHVNKVTEFESFHEFIEFLGVNEDIATKILMYPNIKNWDEWKDWKK